MPGHGSSSVYGLIMDNRILDAETMRKVNFLFHAQIPMREKSLCFNIFFCYKTTRYSKEKNCIFKWCTKTQNALQKLETELL